MAGGCTGQRLTLAVAGGGGAAPRQEYRYAWWLLHKAISEKALRDHGDGHQSD